jgi:hypothetical protein
MDKVDVWFNASVVWEIKGADFQVTTVKLSLVIARPYVCH